MTFKKGNNEITKRSKNLLSTATERTNYQKPTLNNKADDQQAATLLLLVRLL